jgi:hypothetical protein
LILAGCISALLVPHVAASRTEVTARATVMSFGTYSFQGELAGTIRKHGECELGTITVKGIYNGPYPWIMRIYTDNLNYKGIGGGFGIESPAGLISEDGKYSLPLDANCLNWGEEEWLRIPDVNDPGYKSYTAPKNVGAGTHTERIIMGIDPRNADWVSGPDRVLFDADDNPLGDITLETPFAIKFRARVGPHTPVGNYEGRVYIEIVPAP